MMNYDHIQVNTQSSIRIEGSKVVYFDPFKIEAETFRKLVDPGIEVVVKLG